MKLFFLQKFTQCFHFIQGRGYQSTDADDVCMVGFGGGNDVLIVCHDSQVDDIEIVAGQYNADNVFADIMNIAFGRCQNDFMALHCAVFRQIMFFYFRLENSYS